MLEGFRFLLESLLVTVGVLHVSGFWVANNDSCHVTRDGQSRAAEFLHSKQEQVHGLSRRLLDCVLTCDAITTPTCGSRWLRWRSEAATSSERTPLFLVLSLMCVCVCTPKMTTRESKKSSMFKL